MATLEQLSAALVKADAAGNAADAKVFADAIRKMRATPAAEAPEEKGGFLQGVGNLAAGAVRGAGSIGATLLTPYDLAMGNTKSISNPERRQAMDDGLQTMGAEPDSWMYKGGKLAGEIAGTAGAGGAVSNVITRAAPAAVSAAPRVAQALEALKSGGFSLGGNASTGLAGNAADIGIRAVGGAVSGGAQAGLINPGDAGMGVALGGALPVAVQGIGKVAHATGNAVRYIKRPQEVHLANKLAQSLGMTPEQLTSVLQPGPMPLNRLPGYAPTVPQILQNPVSSQLQRTLKTAGANAIGDAERVQQGAYRDALESVAPVGLTVQDAAARAGGAIEGYAKPAYTQASKEVTQLFDAIPSNEAVMRLPLKEMESARAKFLGPGTFGKGGGAVDTAIDEATAIGTRPAPKPILDYSSSDLARKAAGGHSHGAAGETVSKAVPFDQLQKLRSSIGEAIQQADKNGQKQAKAALTTMKNAIDNKVAEVASGTKMADEVFTPDAIDKWGQALNAHSAKKAQFETGPQIGMFRQGGDGQTAMQGAEIPGKFFSGRRSQVEDVQAFKKLIGNRSDLADELKRYAVTEGASTSNVAGDLTSKYLKWMESRSGASRELFTAQELATLKDVGKAVQRGIDAENLGRVSGSDTAQKLEALNSLGLLDSKTINVLATRIPGIGAFTGPALNSLRETAGRTRNNALSKLLANPDDLAQALKPGTPQSNKLLEFMNKSGAIGSKVVPVMAVQ